MKACPKCAPKRLCNDCFDKQLRDMGYARCSEHGLLVPLGGQCVECYRQGKSRNRRDGERLM